MRLVNCNSYKHLSATEKTIAICQAFGDIIGTIDCEICREIIDAGRDSFLVDDWVAPITGIGTSTPSGKAMFQMMAVFAEFERAMINASGPG